MKIVLISAIAMMIAFFSAEDRLVGRWESPRSEKGNVTGVVFKADSSFEGYVNKKPFVTGRYSLQDDVFTMVDNGCDGKSATYRVTFFSGVDSMRFTPISDSCVGRRTGMSKLVLGRVK